MALNLLYKDLEGSGCGPFQCAISKIASIADG
jgi:hypothetical protein